MILGGPKLAVARKSAVASIKAAADHHAANVLPVIREIKRAGTRTLHQIADALNARDHHGAWRQVVCQVREQRVGASVVIGARAMAGAPRGGSSYERGEWAQTRRTLAPLDFKRTYRGGKYPARIATMPHTPRKSEMKRLDLKKIL